MFNPKQYRAKAAEYGTRSKEATDPSQVREYKESSDSFGRLPKMKNGSLTTSIRLFNRRTRSDPFTPLSPLKRSMFFDASALRSSCSGIRFPPNSSASSSTLPDRWVSYWQRRG